MQKMGADSVAALVRMAGDLGIGAAGLSGTCPKGQGTGLSQGTARKSRRAPVRSGHGEIRAGWPQAGPAVNR